MPVHDHIPRLLHCLSLQDVSTSQAHPANLRLEAVAMDNDVAVSLQRPHLYRQHLQTYLLHLHSIAALLGSILCPAIIVLAQIYRKGKGLANGFDSDQFSLRSEKAIAH